VREAASLLESEIRARGVRVKLDDREHLRPGAKFFDWEVKGVPVRLEIGARDLAANEVTVVRRDTAAREQVSLDGAAMRVDELLPDIQRSLLEDATSFRDANTVGLGKRPELFEFLAAGGGFAVTPWCGRPACEVEVKSATSATIRCLTLEPTPGGECAVCGHPGSEQATWGQAY
jgi:prolyl-tRNA synthetase